MGFYRNLAGELFSGSSFHRQAYAEPDSIEYRGNNAHLGQIRSIFGEGYSSLKGWMGKNGVRGRVSPDRIEVGDFFRPESGYTVHTPEGSYFLPDGQIEAMRYRDGFGRDVVAIDEGLIPGTQKNRWAKSFYSDAKRNIGHLYRKYASLRPLLSSLDEVYRGILDKIEDGKGAIYTMTHELSHGLTRHIESREVNEAATDLVTESALSRDGSAGAYHDFKNRLKGVLRSTSAKVSDVIKNSWLSRQIENIYNRRRRGYGFA
ncbi:MAG: hypothetical protein HY516_00840 [Candidatus Aenigmarchaeota archaeon]|nr:hypothetical protein [Candidatus Aenigmarchaeota archaeon]